MAARSYTAAPAAWASSSRGMNLDASSSGRVAGEPMQTYELHPRSPSRSRLTAFSRAGAAPASSPDDWRRRYADLSASSAERIRGLSTQLSESIALNESMQTALEAAQARIRGVEDMAAAARDRVVDLERALQERDAMLAAADAECRAHAAQAAGVSQQLDTLRVEVHRAREEAQHAGAQQRASAADDATMRARAVALEAQLTKCAAENARLAAAARAAEAEAQQLRATMQDSENDRSRMLAETAAAQAAADAAQQHDAAATSMWMHKCRKLEEALTTSTRQSSAAEAAAAADAAHTRAALEESEKQRGQLQARLRAVEAQIASMSAQATESARALSAAQSDARARADDAAQSRVNADAMLAAVRQEMATQEAVINDLRAEVAAQSSAAAEAHANVIRLHSVTIELERQLSSATAQTARLKLVDADTAALKRRVADAEASLRSCERDRDAARNEAQQLHFKLEEAARHVQERQTSEAQLQAAARAAHERVEELHSAQMRNNDDIMHANNEISVLRAQVHTLTSRLEDAASDTEALRAQLQEARNGATAAQGAQASAQAALEQSRARAQELQQDLDGITAELQRAQSELSDAQRATMVAEERVHDAHARASASHDDLITAAAARELELQEALEVATMRADDIANAAQRVKEAKETAEARAARAQLACAAAEDQVRTLGTRLEASETSEKRARADADTWRDRALLAQSRGEELTNQSATHALAVAQARAATEAVQAELEDHRKQAGTTRERHERELLTLRASLQSEHEALLTRLRTEHEDALRSAANETGRLQSALFGTQHALESEAQTRLERLRGEMELQREAAEARRQRDLYMLRTQLTEEFSARIAELQQQQHQSEQRVLSTHGDDSAISSPRRTGSRHASPLVPNAAPRAATVSATLAASPSVIAVYDQADAALAAARRAMGPHGSEAVGSPRQAPPIASASTLLNAPPRQQDLEMGARVPATPRTAAAVRIANALATATPAHAVGGPPHSASSATSSRSQPATTTPASLVSAVSSPESAGDELSFSVSPSPRGLHTHQLTSTTPRSREQVPRAHVGVSSVEDIDYDDDLAAPHEDIPDDGDMAEPAEELDIIPEVADEEDDVAAALPRAVTAPPTVLSDASATSIGAQRSDTAPASTDKGGPVLASAPAARSRLGVSGGMSEQVTKATLLLNASAAIKAAIEPFLHVARSAEQSFSDVAALDADADAARLKLSRAHASLSRLSDSSAEGGGITTVSAAASFIVAAQQAQSAVRNLAVRAMELKCVMLSTLSTVPLGEYGAGTAWMIAEGGLAAAARLLAGSR